MLPVSGNTTVVSGNTTGNTTVELPFVLCRRRFVASEREGSGLIVLVCSGEQRTGDQAGSASSAVRPCVKGRFPVALGASSVQQCASAYKHLPGWLTVTCWVIGRCTVCTMFYSDGCCPGGLHAKAGLYAYDMFVHWHILSCMQRAAVWLMAQQLKKRC